MMSTFFGSMQKKYANLSLEAKAGTWFAICNFINKGISMIVVPLYTRLLTTEEYGTYSVFLSWLNIFIIIATLEISRGHYKVGIIKYDTDVDRYTTSVLGLSNAVTMLFLLIYLCAIPFCNAYLGLPTHVVVGMFIYLLAYPAWEFWAIKQRFAYKYIRLVIVTLLVAIISPLLAIVGIALFGMQSDAAIFSKMIVQGILAFAIGITFIIKCHTLFYWKYWKEVFVFNITLIPYLLSTSILNQADRIMINNMIGSREAAIYSVAYSCGMILLLLNTAVGDSIVPWLYKRLKEEKYFDIESITNKILILIGCANLLLVLFAPEVIAVFAPKQYNDAIWIIPPIAASVFFIFVFQRYINVEVYYSSTVMVSVVSIIVALLNIGINYICLEAWGYFSAGYITLFCYILFCIAHYYNLRHICKKKCHGHQIFKAKKTVLISLIFLIIVFATTLLYEHWYLRYLLMGCICSYVLYKKNFLMEMLRKR